MAIVNKYLVCGKQDTNITCIDIGPFSQQQQIILKGHVSYVYTIVTGKKFFYSGSADGTIGVKKFF